MKCHYIIGESEVENIYTDDRCKNDVLRHWKPLPSPYITEKSERTFFASALQEFHTSCWEGHLSNNMQQYLVVISIRGGYNGKN